MEFLARSADRDEYDRDNRNCSEEKNEVAHKVRVS